MVLMFFDVDVGDDASPSPRNMVPYMVTPRCQNSTDSSSKLPQTPLPLCAGAPQRWELQVWQCHRLEVAPISELVRPAEHIIVKTAPSPFQQRHLRHRYSRGVVGFLSCRKWKSMENHWVDEQLPLTPNRFVPRNRKGF